MNEKTEIDVLKCGKVRLNVKTEYGTIVHEFDNMKALSKNLLSATRGNTFEIVI